MEKYYFEIDAEHNCKEECEYFSIDNYGKTDTVNIGSIACKQCKHNVSYETEEQWIKCEIYSNFVELDKANATIFRLKDSISSQQEYIDHLCKQNENYKEEIDRLKYNVDSLERDIIFIEGGR